MSARPCRVCSRPLAFGRGAAPEGYVKHGRHNSCVHCHEAVVTRSRRSRELRKSYESAPASVTMPDLSGGKCWASPFPDYWFPTEGEEVGATVLCDACPVAATCLRWAVDACEVGVWGGTTTHERKNLRRAMGRAA